MRSLCFLLASILSIGFATTTEVFYNVEGDNDDVIKCAVDAMSRLEESATCVSFTEMPSANELSFTIVHSTECAWQPSNKSIHLSTECITHTLCAELIGKALGVDRPAHDLAHFVALKMNCTGVCNSLRCEHGGRLLTSECRCSCPYAFDGTSCEKLKRVAHFTDSSCGVIEAQDAGSIALSTFPGDQAKATFCQWLIEASGDPWAKIELAFDGLDMDGKDLPPGHICNDVLSIHGAGEVKTIPCNGSPVLKLTSASNWVLIELRTNPWSVDSHAGPSIRYNLITRPVGALAFSDGMSASSTIRSTLQAMSIVALFRLV